MNKFAVEDFDSSTWRKMREHLLQRIERLRTQLEAESTQEASSKLRGRIAELRSILALENPAPNLID